MRVFRTSYKDKSGRTCEAAKWYIEFRDQNEYVRRLPAFTSKAASEEMGRNLEKLVGYHKGSGGQIDPALVRWLGTLSPRTRDKLVAIGLLDPERVAVSKPLSEHLEEFGKALAAKGSTPKQVEQVKSRAKKIIDGCGFRFLGDISASKVMEHLNGLRADTETKRGIGAQTFSFYVQAIKQFCRWMVKDRRAANNPVSHLEGLNVRTDRRHDRRALTDAELRKLLTAAEAGPDRYGMTGPERAQVYRLGVESGLRQGELRSLTRESFNLDGTPATVTVLAGYSKRRREDTLPLRPELAAQLRSFLATKLPGARAFGLPSPENSIDMLREDLDAASVPYVTDAGYADWHCLRHSFITNLARGGVHPKLAQDLARHSDVNLTLSRYSHTLLGDQADALTVLPDLSKPEQQTLRATGTADAQPVEKNLASCLSFRERFQATCVDSGGLSAETASTSETPEKTGETAISPEKNELPPARFELATLGLGNRCSIP
jgi:integrase